MTWTSKESGPFCLFFQSKNEPRVSLSPVSRNICILSLLTFLKKNKFWFNSLFPIQDSGGASECDLVNYRAGVYPNQLVRIGRFDAGLRSRQSNWLLCVHRSWITKKKEMKAITGPDPSIHKSNLAEITPISFLSPLTYYKFNKLPFLFRFFLPSRRRNMSLVYAHPLNPGDGSIPRAVVSPPFL